MSDESEQEESEGSGVRLPDKDEQVKTDLSSPLPPDVEYELRSRGIDPAEVSVLTSQSISIQSGFIPAEILEHYDKLVPGAAKQVLDGVDRQSKHRQELEKQTTLGEERRRNAGLFTSAAIALTGLILSTFIIINSEYWYQALSGVLIACFAIGGPIAATYFAKNMRWNGQSDTAENDE